MPGHWTSRAKNQAVAIIVEAPRNIEMEGMRRGWPLLDRKGKGTTHFQAVENGRRILCLEAKRKGLLPFSGAVKKKVGMNDLGERILERELSHEERIPKMGVPRRGEEVGEMGLGLAPNPQASRES